MIDDDCSPASGILPSWLRSRRAAVGWMAVWLPLLLAAPAAHAGELHPAWPAWLALAAISVTFLAAVAAEVGLTGPRPRATTWLLLAVQAVITVALVAALPAASTAFSLLAVAAGVALGRTWGLRAVLAVPVLSVVTGGIAGGSSDEVISAAVTTWLSGAAAWSYRQLFAVIAELTRTREELARAAVSRERERFSRDLHDLLGHTLSVIVVKAQAVRRLAPTDADATARHGADIETIGRRALSEVRQAVGGYRGTGLAAELDRARAALADAGIAMHATGLAVPATGSMPATADLPRGVDELFGWIVREGVTNVIRHADARQVGVRYRREDGTAHLEIEDDGAARAGDTAGSGLAGLRDRVSAAGGHLEAHPGPGGFHLVVQVPCG